jgi:hypothetical protein
MPCSPRPSRSFCVLVGLIVVVAVEVHRQHVADIGGDVPARAEAEQLVGEILVARVACLGVDELLAVPQGQERRAWRRCLPSSLVPRSSVQASGEFD